MTIVDSHCIQKDTQMSAYCNVLNIISILCVGLLTKKKV